MDSDHARKLPSVEEEFNGSQNKGATNEKKDPLNETFDQSFQEDETDIVLYPVAPRARAPADEQVDVKISPAFQILDQVNARCLFKYIFSY